MVMKESERLRRKRCPTSGVAVEARKLGEDLEVEEFPVPEAALGFDGKPKCGIGHLGGQRREVLGACLVTRTHFRPFCIYGLSEPD